MWRSLQRARVGGVRGNERAAWSFAMTVLISDVVFFSAVSVLALFCAYHLRSKTLAGRRPTKPLSPTQESASGAI